MNKLINSQSIVDKIVTAKHAIAGQEVAKAVLKATKDEITAPKRKHVDFLVVWSDSPTLNILEMAKLLLDRAHNPHWTVAFKSLLTIHQVMNYGSGVFFQHMASNSFSFKFDSFSDTSNAVALHMSKFVRSYANYINSKAVSFRLLGLDFCKLKKGNDESYFCKLKAPELLESLVRLQSQIDDLLAFGAVSGDLCNVIINAAYLMMSKDLARLYSCYKDALENLAKTFMDQDKKFCREALPAYKKCIEQLDKIHQFFVLSEDVGMSKFDIPQKLEINPEDIVVFENHVKSFDSGKKTLTNVAVTLPRPADMISSPIKRHSENLSEKKESLLFDEDFSTIRVLNVQEGEDLLQAKDLFQTNDLFQEKDLFQNDIFFQEVKKESDLFKQVDFAEDFKSFPESTVSEVPKIQPTSLYSTPKMTHFTESMFELGNISSPSSTQINQGTFTQAGLNMPGQMLQPTKLYTSPPPVFSLSDFSNMSVSSTPNRSTISQGFDSAIFSNNFQSTPSRLPSVNGVNINPDPYGPVMLVPTHQPTPQQYQPQPQQFQSLNQQFQPQHQQYQPQLQQYQAQSQQFQPQPQQHQAQPQQYQAQPQQYQAQPQQYQAQPQQFQPQHQQYQAQSQQYQVQPQQFQPQHQQYQAQPQQYQAQSQQHQAQSQQHQAQPQQHQTPSRNPFL